MASRHAVVRPAPAQRSWSAHRCSRAARSSPTCRRSPRVFPAPSSRWASANGPIGVYAAGHARPIAHGSAPVSARHDFRSRVADEGHRHDRARRRRGRAPAAAPRTTACRHWLPRGPAKNVRPSRCAICSSMRPACRGIAVLRVTARARVVRARDLRGAARLSRRAAIASTAIPDSCCSASCSRMLAGQTARSPVRSLARSRARRRCGDPALSAGPGVRPIGSRRPRTRPWRDRALAGEVHDENAAALGGVAGHAGLFGTAPAVGAFARRAGGSRGHDSRTARDARALRSRGSRPCPTARARSAGTRCCRPRRAARGCHRARSATPASPARRCGSIRTRFLCGAAHQSRASRRDGDGIQDVRRAFHDAVIVDLAL